MLHLFKAFVKDEEGQDLVEYVLLVAVVALAAAAGLPPLATAIQNVFTDAQTCLDTANGTGC